MGLAEVPECEELTDVRVLVRVGLTGLETGREDGREEKLVLW